MALTGSTPRPKVAIVTGAAQGIGAAISVRLAKEGFDIALVDLPTSQAALAKVAKDVETHAVRTVCLAADVSQETDVVAMVKAAVDHLGRLDVMVANAGIAPVCPFLEMSPELLDKVYSVNVRGVFLCYREAAKVLVAQGQGGRLIAACSTSGLRTGPNVSGYCASKFAVRALNQGAAVELGQYKITANVYCPTVVETEMWEKIDATITSMQGREKGSYTLERANRVPLGRNATPQDIASMVAFLASDDASFVTGQAMQVTGGDWLS